MESIDTLKIIEREDTLKQWLAVECGLSSATLLPMVGDASFRRYFRVVTPAQSFVVMDAPPAKENCHPYVAVANALRELGINTPDIFHADIARGFLLLTDFGDMTYLNALNNDNADKLYQPALQALATLQSCSSVAGHTIPTFGADLMWREWAWHKEWFLQRLLGLSLSAVEEENLQTCFALLVESAIQQPQVFMHRDYHSANLMVLPENKVGVLDFQDAFIGPLTYDLVSLLRDCYIAWPEERVMQWVKIYSQQITGKTDIVDHATFIRWFDWMGVERHLKALFTFARKKVRDEQAQYLQHIPRTLHYILTVSHRHPALRYLHDYYRDKVWPQWEKMRVSLCVQ